MSIPTVHILFGSDDLAIQLHVQDLIEKMDDQSNASMNITRLDGTLLDFNELNTAVNALSFLSDGRLVILSNTFKAFTAEKKKAADEKKKRILDLIASMPATTTLVLLEILDASSPESKRINNWMSRLRSSISQKVNIVLNEFNFPNQKSMAGWIVRETRRQSELHNKQIRIDPEAARLLADLAGTDTRITSQEIGKLLEYVNYERDIVDADVLKVCSVDGQANIFDLVDAMSYGDGKQAQICLDRLVQDHDPRLSLWPMIVRQFRLLLQAREVMDSGGNQATITQELHVHPFVAGKLLKQGKQFDIPALERIYHRLLELENEIRTFKMDYALAMEILIAELAR
jgi:DNA polymerase-3 subunit delta